MTTAEIPAMSTTQAQVSNSHWPTVPFSNPAHFWKNWQFASSVHVEPALSTRPLKSSIPLLIFSSTFPLTFLFGLGKAKVEKAQKTRAKAIKYFILNLTLQ